jgi:hypothetical protein
MKGNNSTYWNWVINQRNKDIEAEEAIGSPDPTLMKILIEDKEKAQKKLDELNG